MPSEIQQVDCDSEQQDICHPDFGPQNDDDDDQDIAFDENSEMNSFIPIPQTTNKEAEAIRNHLHHQSISWPSLDSQPLSEFTTPYLATLAFPCLFPAGKGDPTNPSLHRQLPFHEKVKHLIKFAERKNGT